MKPLFVISFVVIVILGVSMSSIEAQTATPSTPIMGTGWYDDTTPLIDYFDETIWLTAPDPLYYNGESTYTYDDRASFQFWFYGSAFTIYGAKWPTGNPAATLCISGSPCSSISFYSPTTDIGVEVLTVVFPDVQTRSVIVLGGNGLLVDSVYIHPVEIMPTQPPIEVTVELVWPEETQEVAIQTPVWQQEIAGGVFQQKTDSGQVMMVIMQGITIAFLGVLTTAFLIWGFRWNDY